jgi:hypothetical protein
MHNGHFIHGSRESYTAADVEAEVKAELTALEHMQEQEREICPPLPPVPAHCADNSESIFDDYLPQSLPTYEGWELEPAGEAI